MVSSFVEQCAISKGGLTCIYGRNIQGINYGISLCDFLLKKMQDSEKFDEILCISFDRTLGSLLSLQQTCSRIHFKSISIPTDVQLNTSSIQEIVRNNMLNLLHEVNEILNQRKRNYSSNQDHPPRLGLMIFSLSEISFYLGETWTLRWLRNLNSLLSSIDSSEKTEPLASILLLLHTSLHKITYQNEIQKLCSNLVYVTPNLQGIYGPSITCTTKTIRCSPHTSKVTEGIDFFTQKFSDLQADSSMSTSTNPTNNPSVEGLVHVSTNHFNGIEMTSASSAIEKNDDNTSTEKSLSKLSLGQRMTLETNPTSETATSSRGEEVNLGVQSVKPTFAILNQHENEDDGDDLDDDPDADLDL